MATQQFNTNVDVNGEVKGTSLDINGAADILGNLELQADLDVSGTITGDGSGVDSINASNISSGTLAAARVATLNQNTTGSAATLTTARTIAGVSFNGSANISLNNNAITNGAGYTGDQSQSDINALAITTVGTITSGGWRASEIATTYTAAKVTSIVQGDSMLISDSTGDVTIAALVPNMYGSIIKLLPSDFVTNDDAGVGKFGIGYVDHAGTTYGMKPTNAATELYTFVSIPRGMKATHVDVYDKYNKGVIVYEAQIDATTLTSKGTGNCNTTIDITDVSSTATNFLAIQVTTTATSDRVFGGQVTIAAI